jgi:hypothetical protein
LNDLSRQSVIMDATTAQLAALGLSETSAPPATFHGWSRLPDEVKVEILAHNLDQPDVVDAVTHRKVFKAQLEPIIGTQNRELVSLALETYYNRNTFKVTVYELSTRTSCPPAASGHLIKTMEVHVGECGFYAHESLETMLIEWDNGWTSILTPLRPLDEGLINQLTWDRPDFGRARRAWQGSFPNLRTLHFSLRSRFHIQPQVISQLLQLCHRCGVSATQVQRLGERLRETSIELRATKATAVIERILFRPYDDDDGAEEPPVYCECSKPISDRIVQMATKPKD